MSSDRSWWDRFWDRRAQERGGLDPELDETAWYGLVWKVGLEYLLEVFNRSSPGKEMVECGCGSAVVSSYLARRAGYSCTMLDYSRPALQRAIDRFSAAGLPGRFLLGDINRLCFSDRRFDAVYSGGVIEFFSDIRIPIREMVRVLRPGGLFAATIVPDKFSIQTIADWERTAAYAIANAVQGRFRDAFKPFRSIPADYGVSRTSLDDYIAACREVGLESLTGLAATPFPALALPKVGQAAYARLMRRLLPAWRKFNLAQSRFAKIWGISYVIHGIKGQSPR